MRNISWYNVVNSVNINHLKILSILLIVIYTFSLYYYIYKEVVNIEITKSLTFKNSNYTVKRKI